MKNIENSKYSIDVEGNAYNKNGKKLVPIKTRKGYTTVKIVYLDKKVKTKLLHRLVAETYLPNPENKQQVNHINGIKSDNRLVNLEWCTQEENLAHAKYVLGVIGGEASPRSTITAETVHAICKMLTENYRNIDIAKLLNVKVNIIRDIRTKKSWELITAQYEFSRRKENISNETFIWVCECLEKGCSTKEIMEKSKLSKDCISRIRTRKLRAHLSKDYKF